jgi:hypothetical protein
MKQQEAIRTFLAQYKNREVLAILEPLMGTPEGRNKITASLLHPVKLNVDYLTATKKSLDDIDYPITTRLKEYQLFLAALPDEEQQGQPFQELATLISQLDQLVKERIDQSSL